MSVTPDPCLHCHPQHTHARHSGQPSELEQAYLATCYVVFVPPCRLRIRVGQLHPEVDQLLDEHGCRSWAYVTACNPGSVQLSEEENRLRQCCLEEEVAQGKWKFYRGEGVGDDGDWPPEQSLFIVGIGKEEAMELARRRGQAALVYGERGQPAQLVWLMENALKEKQ